MSGRSREMYPAILVFSPLVAIFRPSRPASQDRSHNWNDNRSPPGLRRAYPGIKVDSRTPTVSLNAVFSTSFTHVVGGRSPLIVCLPRATVPAASTPSTWALADSPDSLMLCAKPCRIELEADASKGTAAARRVYSASVCPCKVGSTPLGSPENKATSLLNPTSWLSFKNSRTKLASPSNTPSGKVAN